MAKSEQELLEEIQVLNDRIERLNEEVAWMKERLATDLATLGFEG